MVGMFPQGFVVNVHAYMLLGDWVWPRAWWFEYMVKSIFQFRHTPIQFKIRIANFSLFGFDATSIQSFNFQMLQGLCPGRCMSPDCASASVRRR